MFDFPFKLGALPAERPVALRALPYYVAGDLPRAPSSVAPPKFDWGMLGNDRYGDCGCAGIVHGIETTSYLVSTKNEKWPTDEEVVDGYLTFTHGQDSGVVLARFLEYVRTHGFCGRKVKAYAPIEIHDVPTLQTAVWMYGFAYSGIVVTQAMQQAFSQKEAWTTDLLDSPIAGGHCVPIVGYDDQYVYVVTWGTIQAVTYSMLHQILTESWATITQEFVDAKGDGHGLALDALLADLNKLN